MLSSIAEAAIVVVGATAPTTIAMITTRRSATMCRPATCKKCGKTTWAGCGQHVDQVMRSVPDAQRCTCPREAAGGGFMAKLFGR